jgi:hypothetical protein
MLEGGISDFGTADSDRFPQAFREKHPYERGRGGRRRVGNFSNGMLEGTF